MTQSGRPGPLAGLRVVEMAAIGPVPFAGTMLASMGADIVRVERPGKQFAAGDVTAQGREYVTLDLKDPADQARALDLIASADLLLEGFRPGVMERLGLGPDKAHARNPALVYGRMTGWGQEGPLASAPGHDINYIAITGALHAIGTAAQPVQPLNLVGDYGGGALYLVVGVLAALREAAATGRGQVVDAAMCDGALNLLLPYAAGRASGAWVAERERNVLDGGAHFYGVFECADGKFFSLGAIEPQFYAELRRLCGLEGDEWDAQLDKAAWPGLREKLRAVMKTKTRDEWTAILEGSDVCAAPILDLDEAKEHPHLKARGAFVDGPFGPQPAAAPRFSAHPRPTPARPPAAPLAVDDALARWTDARK
ncbi:CaiB/BaiF CoA-transferase family protein [Albimonas sp. CAU 1670]|uniref:CaiB/BaiF CoA transferase family protein n=1 Tax=Albimonas sp. CAU 1670 TaxID=3032599 RepID=UPI0023DBB88C|nr:CaiB/BaiF CoA-transferase family protein [Albimonas sp. CAU 1670]MDF2234115.1 CaiB/BaiF CoA-transferase family protein [Albimonas sp. CAU 1670]